MNAFIHKRFDKTIINRWMMQAGKPVSFGGKTVYMFGLISI